MATIELVLRDDNHQIIGQQSTKKYSLNLKSQTVHDIEGAVEEFKNCALPDITLSLLEAAQTAFIQINQRLYDQGLLEGFRYLGRFLISADGTGEFSSSQIHCAHCGERHHQNGHVSYYHQLLAAVIVHPDRKEVLPQPF